MLLACGPWLVADSLCMFSQRKCMTKGSIQIEAGVTSVETECLQAVQGKVQSATAYEHSYGTAWLSVCAPPACGRRGSRSWPRSGRSARRSLFSTRNTRPRPWGTSCTEQCGWCCDHASAPVKLRRLVAPQASTSQLFSFPGMVSRTSLEASAELEVKQGEVDAEGMAMCLRAMENGEEEERDWPCTLDVAVADAQLVVARDLPAVVVDGFAEAEAHQLEILAQLRTETRD